MPVKPIETDTEFLRKTVSDLTEQIDLLTILQDISKQIVSRFDFDPIVEKFLDIVAEVVNYRLAILFLHDGESGEYRVGGCRGIDPSAARGLRPETAIIDWVLREGRWTPIPEDAGGKETAVHSILPLRGVKKQLGFLLIASDAGARDFNKSNMTVLSFIADQTGIALENQDLYAQLDRSRNYIYNIVESIKGGIVAVDMAGRITLINKNATAMLGIQTGDLPGKPFREVFPEKLAAVLARLEGQIAEEGFAIETRFTHRPFRDFSITLGINATALSDENLRQIGTIFVMRDLMASMEIQRLTRLDEMKSEFVSNVSHELRTPLSIIKSYVEALLDQVDEEDHRTRREFLTVINDETDRLAILVGDLLDISRIESGRFTLTLEPVNLKEVIGAVANRLDGKSEKHRIVTHVPGDLPALSADRDKLTQVFINLIGNAIKFSPEGGEVRIEAEAEGESIRCTVSDQGLGIAQEHIPRIFEKFFRADNSDTYEIPGTGLGLPIVKHIVESHGGTITVQSREGEGSDFTLRLPLEGR